MIYKKCKLRLLKVYGPRPEEAFEQALAMTLKGLPSDAAKEIRSLVCPGLPPMKDCHCHIPISSIWRKLLPRDVRGAIANMDLQSNFDQTIEAADVYHKAYLASSHSVAAIAAPTTPASAGANKFNDLDSLAAHVTAEIAAFRGQNYRSNGQSRGQSNARRGTQQGAQQGGQSRRPPPTRKPNPHPDGPPPNACVIHWNHGRQAYSCANKETCPWKDVLAPRPQRTRN